MKPFSFKPGGAPASKPAPAPAATWTTMERATADTRAGRGSVRTESKKSFSFKFTSLDRHKANVAELLQSSYRSHLARRRIQEAKEDRLQVEIEKARLQTENEEADRLASIRRASSSKIQRASSSDIRRTSSTTSSRGSLRKQGNERENGTKSFTSSKPPTLSF
eukprot:1617071-Rhodomonas_salina.1